MSRYTLYIIKNILEHLCIYPFVLLGKLFPLKLEGNSFDICFLFPFYHTGGAEKVHLQIVAAAKHKKCLVIFTRKSVDDNFLAAYKNLHVTILDISTYTDNKWKYWLNLFFRGKIAATLQKKGVKTVFNGQCNFAYKLSPWLPANIRQIELIHSFNSFSQIRIPYIRFYQKTVMISQVRIAEHIEQYKKLGMPNYFTDRIVHINNAIDIAPIEHQKTEPIKVIYVGRNSPEKRIPLFLKIAQRCTAENIAIEFHFVGITSSEIDNAPSNCVFHGSIADSNQIQKLYAASHILMLLSSTEGFPMVVIEAMAQGCAIIATPVGDIPRHVASPQAGLLLSQVANEQAIEDEVMHYLHNIISNTHQLAAIAKHNKAYAMQHFHIKAFNFAYQSILGIETT